jgi:lipid-A-disaccharide synthase
MKIFVSAGEPSGDLHGANLVRALRGMEPGLEVFGLGGPQMATAGCQVLYDLTRYAVMWITRAAVHLPQFAQAYRSASALFRREPLDAVVLIDFPGFNWWIARKARRHGIPVFYYGPPQIWAWAGWRIRKMRRLVDHVLCKLPFEPGWYDHRGCQATYVGHPYFDELHARQLDPRFLQEFADPRPLVAILPGSRSQEVTANLPWLLKAADVVRQSVPEVRFAVAAYRPEHARLARQLASRHSTTVDVFVRRTPEIIHLAHCAMAVSGSVSLELLHEAKPTVVVYRVGWLAFWTQLLLRRVPYITLVNLLACRELPRRTRETGIAAAARPGELLMPEYLACRDRSDEVAAHVVTWLRDKQQHQARVDALRRLADQLSEPGASRRAAEYLMETLRGPRRSASIPAPHFPADVALCSALPPIAKADEIK